MKLFLAAPMALVNGPVVWLGVRVLELVQGTHFDVSLGDAMAVGGLASLVPSAFMVWAGLTAKKMSKMHEDHIAVMTPWREDVLQRLVGVESTVKSCDVTEFREEIISFLNSKTDEYQQAFTKLDLRVCELEQTGEEY